MISWAGAKMPLSSELADAVLDVLAGAAQGDFSSPELEAARPMLETQARLSKLPTPATLLVERFRSREGQHLFLYPFAGRNAHIGLGSLLAWRLAKHAPNTFSISINDYGLELLSALPVDPAGLVDHSLLAEGDLLHDVLASLNSSELARRRFREIARVAGLISTGYPGQPKSARQLQASSTLFYEVFRKYDAGNMLLTQAQSEVLSQELDIRRLAEVLERMRAADDRVRRPRGAEPVRVAADGRALPREAHHREIEGPARPDAEGDGEGSGACRGRRRECVAPFADAAHGRADAPRAPHSGRGGRRTSIAERDVDHHLVGEHAELALQVLRSTARPAPAGARRP